jgi:hypothetical protein
MASIYSGIKVASFFSIDDDEEDDFEVDDDDVSLRISS